MVSKVIVGPEHVGQRIDNFLLARLKGLPKSRLYRALRNGEVRVNGGRIKPSYKLLLDDQVRIPPLRVSSTASVHPSKAWIARLEQNIIFENDELIVLDKPSGIAVHGGSGLHGGVIEILRLIRPKHAFLELVHRLDRQTSGCLLIAKKRRALLYWQQLLVTRQTNKQYLALVRGRWQLGNHRCQAPLKKNVLQSGERLVKVDSAGKSAETWLRPLRYFDQATLLEIKLLSGRTHQIRVHAAHLGYPLAGDDKYGDQQFNQQLRQLGLKRLFLHAGSIGARQLDHELAIAMGVMLPSELQQCLQSLS